MNLAALLFDVARRQPDAPAVTDDNSAWSYREFAHRISGIAGGLAGRGLERGDRVVLCMENCGEFLEVMFACWTAGFCAVPVNARLHVREIEHIATDSGARLLVATSNLAESLAQLEHSVETLSPVISIHSGDYTALLDQDAPIRPVDTTATDWAWLFYTSGTTGRPKG